MSVVASQSLTQKQTDALLRGQRWFSGAKRPITAANWLDVMVLPGERHRLCMVRVEFEDGERQTHTVVVDEELRDCAHTTEAQMALFQFAISQESYRASHGLFESVWEGPPDVPIEASSLRALTGEQSNSSFVLREQFVFKLIRRVHAGPNPEVELLQYLAKSAGSSVPTFCGSIGYQGEDGERFDLAVVTEKIAEAQDGWQLACDTPERLVELVKPLAQTLAALHNALGASTRDNAFLAEEFFENERDRLSQSLVRLARTTKFERSVSLLSEVDELPKKGGKCIRVHGDLHLGQTLVRGDTWYFLDFEGEPTRTLEERRAKTSPLKDVAGMLRSFSYAEASCGRTGLATSLREPFISAYRGALAQQLQPPDDVFSQLLVWYEIEKALYELDYEERYRPDWVHIPRTSLERLCDQVLASEVDVPTTKAEALPDLKPGQPRKKEDE